MSWIKSLAFVLAAVSIFSCGYKYAASLYEADIADLQAQHALAIQEKTNEYRAKEQHQAEALVAAWDQLEQARAESVDLRADIDRVRKLADGYRARLSSASADSCTSLRKRLVRCAELLEEGAGLSAEGSELAERVAARKDAVVKIYGGK